MRDAPSENSTGGQFMPCRGRRVGAFGLTDLLAVGGVAMILLCFAVPGTLHARRMAERGLCAINLKTIGAAAHTYAGANDGNWMVPPFSRAAIDWTAVEYRDTNGVIGNPASGYSAGEVGFDRDQQNTSDSPIPGGANGSIAVSTTRAFWTLARSGELSLNRFVCPSSLDIPDPMESASLYYDFTSWNHVSYGYQVPFGPPATRPRESAHYRQVWAADKGPFYLKSSSSINPAWVDAMDRPLTSESPPSAWQPYNSPNHGGAGNGEGQNCLFNDGSVEFARTPLAGIQAENIYTLFSPGSWAGPRFGLIHGYSPHKISPAPYPGQDAFGTGVGFFSSTDSLLYP